jgi:hypothetical protein
VRKNYVIAQRVISLSGQHIEWETKDDDKNIKLNSRNYTATSGDKTAVQIKPNISVGGTPTMVGLEVSPRFAAGIAGTGLVAIKADPLLKAGAGNLSGGAVGVQSNIDFGVSGTRTIGGDISAFESFLAIPSTYTYNGIIAFLRVRSVNIKGWDAFINFDDASVGLFGSEQTGGSPLYLKCYVGTTLYTIKMDTA